MNKPPAAPRVVPEMPMAAWLNAQRNQARQAKQKPQAIDYKKDTPR